MPDHGQRKNGILYAHSSFFSFVLCPIRFDGLSIFNGARDGSGASDLALFDSRAKKSKGAFGLDNQLCGLFAFDENGSNRIHQKHVVSNQIQNMHR